MSSHNHAIQISIMNKWIRAHTILNYLIATVWVINGLFCKLLNFVPRHQLIVARILGNDHAGFLTRTIGLFELLMAAWILSAVKSRLCAVTQIAIVATMNTIEFSQAPDLLLFGKANALIAFLFITAVYFNEFKVNNALAKQL
jgi:hypothetical protein